MGYGYAVPAINQARLGNCLDQCNLQHPERYARSASSSTAYLTEYLIYSVGLVSVLFQAAVSNCLLGKPRRLRVGYHSGHRGTYLSTAPE
jgi:hypothetical protein